MSYADEYSALASYFAQSGGSKSAGKAGGAGYTNDQPSTNSGTGDQQSASAQSGSGWISAAVSMNQDQKQIDTFLQSYGGITNNQVIDSPYATGAVTNAPSSVSAPNTPVTSPPTAIGASAAPTTLIGQFMLALVAGLVVYFAVKKG